MSSYDPADRMAAQMRVREYLKTVLDERDQGEGDDLLTRVAAWRRNPRFQSEEEVLSMATLLFAGGLDTVASRSEEHTSELQSLMRISYAVFCLKKKKDTKKALVQRN